MKNLSLKAYRKIMGLDSPKLMGILNVTPDSFSDGGQFDELTAAVKRAKEMIKQGANIIDIGGESSGPGSLDVSLDDEIKRVVPVVRAIREANKDVWISVDTYKSEVALRAVEAGADIVNDVTAGRGDKGMPELMAKLDVPIVLMYSKDPNARTTKRAAKYDDVIKTIKEFFVERIEIFKAAGVRDEQIILDPGMGAFVSTIPEYSFEIIDRLSELADMGYPLLVGPSRKSFLGGAIQDRLKPSVDAALKCIKNGAHIVRVHDVNETLVAIAA